MTPRLPQVALLGHRRVLQLNISAPLSAADDIGDDLALLAACNHTILSYGTFGQVQWSPGHWCLSFWSLCQRVIEYDQS